MPKLGDKLHLVSKNAINAKKSPVLQQKHGQ